MMKRIYSAGVGLFICVIGTQPSVAADLPIKGPAYMAPVAAPIFDWSGFYLGGHVGYGRGTANPETAGTPSQYPEGWFGGVQLGYDYQFSNNVVLGAEVDISVGDMSDSAMDGLFLMQTSKIDYFGTARLRLGYASDRFLPYLTGGLAWVHGVAGMNCPAGAPLASICGVTGPFNLTDNSTSVGWTVGGGLEYRFADNWTAKIEYLYADLGNTTLAFNLPVVGRVSGDVSQRLNLVRVGLNYRFATGNALMSY